MTPQEQAEARAWEILNKYALHLTDMDRHDLAHAITAELLALREEIAAFRAENAGLREHYQHTVATKDALQAEVARLRNVLEDLANTKPNGDMEWLTRWMAGYARATLAKRMLDQAKEDPHHGG